MDIGAHEVSGANGTAIYFPLTDADVGTNVGACFLDATGNSQTNCSGPVVVTPNAPYEIVKFPANMRTINYYANS